MKDKNVSLTEGEREDFIRAQDTDYQDNDNDIPRVEKVPIRIAPTEALPNPCSMVYKTQTESLTETKKEMQKRTQRANTSVTFDKVCVRQYPVKLGDNPAVTRGAPLTIDWDPLCHVEYPMEDYEKARSPRRSGNVRALSFKERELILERCGITGKEIRKVLASVNNARAQRHKTVTGLMKGKDKWEESVERLSNHCKRYLSVVHPRIKKEKNLENWLMQFHSKTINSDLMKTPQGIKYLKSSVKVHAQ